METIGNLDLVPEQRRVAGPGASYLMAPFTHVSTDRPSRFSDGTFGVLYAGNTFEVALFETIHHHGKFMARTDEPAGWTSQFREILLDINAQLHDLRSSTADQSGLLQPDNYEASQALGSRLRAQAPTVSFTRAFAIQVASVWVCFIQTAPQIPSRVGISTTTGTARRLISTAMRTPAKSIGSCSRQSKSRQSPSSLASGSRCHH